MPHPDAENPAPVLRDARGRRIYSEDEIAVAMAHLEANNGNVLATSEALGIPDQTLRDWRNGQRRALACNPQLRERIRQQLAERARGVADRMLTRLETADLEEVGVRDAAIVFGIVTEKSLLLDGDATSITEHRSDQDAEKEQRIRARYLRKLAPVQATPLEQPAPVQPVEPGDSEGAEAGGK